MNCKHCQSTRFIKAGITRNQQRYKCKDCLRHFTNTPPRGKPAAMKALAVLLYTLGNASFGMIARLLGVSNVAVLKWIRKEALQLERPQVKAESTLIVVDEMWHFVNGKKTKFGSGKPMTLCQGEWLPGCWVGVMIQPAKNS